MSRGLFGGAMPYRLSFIVMTFGLAACNLVAPPGSLPATPVSAVEEGRIEQLRLVMRDRDDLWLSDVQKLPGPMLYAEPPESEATLGMTQAVQAVLRNNTVLSGGAHRSGQVIGAAYLVRLQCGGIVYVFQEGRPSFTLGEQVRSGHGLMPSLSPAR